MDISDCCQNQPQQQQICWRSTPTPPTPSLWGRWGRRATGCPPGQATPGWRAPVAPFPPPGPPSPSPAVWGILGFREAYVLAIQVGANAQHWNGAPAMSWSPTWHDLLSTWWCFDFPSLCPPPPPCPVPSRTPPAPRPRAGGPSLERWRRRWSRSCSLQAAFPADGEWLARRPQRNCRAVLARIRAWQWGFKSLVNNNREVNKWCDFMNQVFRTCNCVRNKCCHLPSYKGDWWYVGRDIVSCLLVNGVDSVVMSIPLSTCWMGILYIKVILLFILSSLTMVNHSCHIAKIILLIFFWPSPLATGERSERMFEGKQTNMHNIQTLGD